MRLHWNFLVRDSWLWLEMPDRLLVDCRGIRPIGDQAFPVTVMSHALKGLNVNAHLYVRRGNIWAGNFAMSYDQTWAYIWWWVGPSCQNYNSNQLSERRGLSASGGLNREPCWNPSNITEHYGIEGFKGAPQLGQLRSNSLSDSRWKKFPVCGSAETGIFVVGCLRSERSCGIMRTHFGRAPLKTLSTILPYALFMGL